MNRRTDSPANRIYGQPGPRTRVSRSRGLGIRDQYLRILIVCEGAKTEPNYFRAFRVATDIFGEGLETIRVVEEAIRRNEEDGPYDQIWCVFDRDDFPASDFDNAIHKVRSREKEGFRVAYSNQSFELWYVLHFEFLQSAVHRDHYITRLNELLDRKYRKGDPDIYTLLQEKGDESQARQWAQSLREQHAECQPFSQRCPETTVDELVRVLREIQAQHR